jgi:hypothetical protein
VSDFVFQCHYCAEHVPLDRAVISYVVDRELSDGRRVVLPAVHCGTYCAQQAVRTRAGTPSG